MSDADKRRNIVASLAGLTRDANEEVAAEDLRDALNRKVPGEGFDGNLFEQLVAQVPRRGDGRLTLNNFADIWIEAEKRLLATNENHKGELARLQEELENYNKKKLEAEATERPNARNIMEGSELFVTVNRITNIRNNSGSPFDANFVLSCEGLVVDTGPAPNADEFVVNKNFQFPIRLGSEMLVVQMIDVARGDVVEGDIKINLYDLRSQENKQFVQRFVTMQGNALPTEADLTCRWIYSNVRLYDTLITKTHQEMKALNEEQAESDHYMQQLVAPFPELRRGAFKPVLAGGEKLLTFEPRPIPTYNIEEKPWNKLPTTSNPSTTRFLLFSVYFYLLAALVTHLEHCVFLDLTVAFLLFGSLQLNAPLLIQTFAVKCIVAILLAVFLAIVWLAVYLKPWWNTGYIDNFSLLGIRRASVFFEFVLMLARFFTLAALFISMKTLPKGEDEFAPDRADARPDFG